MDEKQTLIEKLQSIAKDLGTTTVARHDFLRRSGASERKIQRLFGSYNDLVLAAGLSPRAFPTSDAPTYSDDDLLNEVVRVLRLPNSKLTRVFFEQNASVSTSACERRFGGWINTIKAAGERLIPDEEVDLLQRIREYTVPNLPPRLATAPAAEDDGEEQAGSLQPDTSEQNHTLVSAGLSNLYGDFINFRGLQHAPVNEQGVVFLFGMICRELGYVVEIIKPGFPDCEAKRRIRGKAHYFSTDLFLHDDLISNGESICFDTEDKMVVAGNGSDYIISDGGELTLVAGSSITLKPGFHAEQGSYFHAYIDDAGCSEPLKPITIITAETDQLEDPEPEMDGMVLTDDPSDLYSHLKVYPNPTTGKLNVEISSPDPADHNWIYLYDFQGRIIDRRDIIGPEKIEMDLSTSPAGVYIIRLVNGVRAETVKVVRQY